MNLEIWLESNIGYETPRPGLDRIKKAISLFGFEFSRKKVITVAGTNGKGETSRSLFRTISTKHRCSLWTSPHLKSVTERFEDNEGFVQELKLLTIFENSKRILDEEGIKLSYFEFLFLCFLEYSKENEVLILEVGLGGRLDAVNAIDCDVALISSISRDHAEFLGNRYESILMEKIAISRSGKLLVTNLEQHYLRKLSGKYCNEKSVKHQDLFELGIVSSNDNFSIRNQKLAKFVCEKKFGLKFEFEDVHRVFIPFNFEEARCHGLSSHNTDGVRKGIQFLNDAKYTKLYNLVLLSFSKRDFNDALTMIKTVKKWNECFGSAQLAITSFKHPKAMGSDEAKRLAQSENVEFFNDAKEAIIQLQMAGKDVLVLGSNYFLSTLGASRTSSRE